MKLGFNFKCHQKNTSYYLSESSCLAVGAYTSLLARFILFALETKCYADLKRNGATIFLNLIVQKQVAPLR